MFNLLGSVEGLCVLDIFAGSGALGLESLSRGSKKLVCVDGSKKAIAIIKKNIEKLNPESEVKTVCHNLSSGFKFLTEYGPFDLVLADPPYGKSWPKKLLEEIEADALNKGARVVIETCDEEKPIELDKWEIIKQKKYGRSHITIIRRRDND